MGGEAPPNAMFVCVTRCPAPRVSGTLSRATADNINMDSAVTILCVVSVGSRHEWVSLLLLFMLRHSIRWRRRMILVAIFAEITRFARRSANYSYEHSI